MSEACRRCGSENPAWSASSPLWNAVMRGGSINGESIWNDLVCATCFMVLAEEKGIASGFRVTAQTVNGELETVTPSGRVWDEARSLWVDPGEQGEPSFKLRIVDTRDWGQIPTLTRDNDSPPDTFVEGDRFVPASSLTAAQQKLVELRESNPCRGDQREEEGRVSDQLRKDIAILAAVLERFMREMTPGSPQAREQYDRMLAELVAIQDRNGSK